MAIKKKLNPTSTQTTKSIAELLEKRKKIRARVEFRRDLLESQKRVNYKNEFDRLQGAKKLSGLDAHVKSRMKVYKVWLVNHLKVMVAHIEFIIQNFKSL